MHATSRAPSYMTRHLVRFFLVGSGVFLIVWYKVPFAILAAILFSVLGKALFKSSGVSK